MRQNSWVALAIVFGIITLALFASANSSFTTISVPNGTDPEATVGDTLVLAEGAGITITGDTTTDTVTISSSGGVTLVDDPGGTSLTTGSESGLEIIGGTDLSMLRGCSNGQIEKWDSSTEAWLCSADSTGGSPTFDAIASGTNVTADMTVGTGASVLLAGLGHIEATQALNPIHNSTGATLFKCTAVYINGFSIPFDMATAGIADADATNAAVGLIHDDIADGADGFAVVVGSVAGLDTTNGESWAVGDVLYLNTGGTSADTECGNTLTNVRPTGATTEIEKMAVVERVHATNGALKIIAKGAFDDVPNLADDSIRVGDGVGVPTVTAIPDCDDTGGNHLNYDTTGNTLSCGTSGGAGGINSFETIVTDNGTDPVADSSTDSLTLTTTTGNIQITGDSATDTVTFDVCGGCITGLEILDTTITFADVNETITLAGNPALSTGQSFFGSTGIIFEGTTADTVEGLLTAPTITGTDKTWTLPDVTGTIITTGDTATVTGLMIASDTITLSDISYAATLAGNPSGLADECFWSTDGGVGGGFICEGSTADTNEQLYLFPDVNGADTTDRIVVNPNEVTSIEGRSLTVTAGTLNADPELYTETHTLWIEDPTASDDFQTIWTAVTNSYTITAITCESDQTVNFDLEIDDGTPAGVNGSDIACTTYATDASLAGDTGLDAGERLDLAITSVSGTPTWVSISWTVTKND